MAVEETVSTLAGLFAGRVALVVFGLDSDIEHRANGQAQRRL